MVRASSSVSSRRNFTRLVWVMDCSHSPWRRARAISATASSISSITEAGTSVRVVRRRPATAAVCSSVPTISPSTTPSPEWVISAASSPSVASLTEELPASSSRAGSMCTFRLGAVMRSSPASMRVTTASFSRSVVTMMSDSSTVWPPRSAITQRTRMGTSSV